MARVIVVGAGISGVACARVVLAAGHDVEVLDRGRRVGGRMALRDQDGRPVDTGASYLTVSEPMFRAVVDDWEQRGLARAWTDTFATWSPNGEGTKSGPVRWAAPAGLRELVADLGTSLPIRQEITVDEVALADGHPRVGGVTADAVVLAMPDPEARRLLSPDIAGVTGQLNAEFDPVLALSAAWPRRSWPDHDGIFVNDHPVLSWVADDGLRRGDDAPVLVAHSTSDFARNHLDEPDRATASMVTALKHVVGIEPSLEPVHTSVHRWTHARPAGTHDEPFLLTDHGIGACGDAWSAKPSVEAAFCSGHRLGQALVDRLATPSVQ